MIENSTNFFTYKDTWRDKGRKDLASPSKVMQVYFEEEARESLLFKNKVKQVYFEREPRESELPFEVKLDTDRLGEILQEEGTTKGRSLYVGFNERESALRRLLSARGEDKVSTVVNNALEIISKPIIYGSCALGEEMDLKMDKSYLITLYLGDIYDLSLLTSPSGKNDDVLKKFKMITEEVLIHEIGHARQPDGMRREGKRTAIAIAGGVFVLIDQARSHVLPSLGLYEPLVSGAEVVVAGAIGQRFINTRPQEKYARKYLKDVKPMYEGIIDVSLSSEEKLSKDNYWKSLKETLIPLSRE